MADRAFHLKLKSNSDSHGEWSVVLKVVLPATYPKTVPLCNVSYRGAIPVSAKNKIGDIISLKPRELLGSEMIYELATSITDVLEDTLTDKANTEEIPALHEERARQEAATTQKEEHAREARIQEQRNANEEEERLLSRMVEQEQARLAKLNMKSPNSSDSFETMNEISGGITFDQTIRTKAPGGKIIVFRTVHSKAKYRSGPVTEVFTVNPSGSGADSAPFLALKECIIYPSRSEEKLKKAIQNLEGDLEVLRGLPSHPSILKPLSFRIQRLTAARETDAESWKVSVLTEMSQRGSLKDLLETIGTLDIKNLRSWSIQMIEGLDFYHRHRIAHSALRPENVLFELADSGMAVIKLVDGLYQNDLHLMKDQVDTKFSAATSAYWVAPELSAGAIQKASTPKDVWDLGIIIIQMIFGLDVQKLYSSPSVLIDSIDLSGSLRDLLSRMFKADPRKRPTAFDLLPNEFLRSDDPVLEMQSSPTISRMTSTTSVTPSRHIRPRHDSSHVMTTSSRYINDFVEAGRLGKGGFGEVVRARNKLDGRFYAVKKIVQTSAAALSGVLSEIILLSSMNHPNVVRYYTAWVEEERTDQADSASSSSENSGNPSMSQIDSSRIDFGHSTPGLDFISSSGYPKIEFGYESGEDEQDSEAVLDEDDDDERDDHDGGPKDKNISSPVERRRRSSAKPPLKTTLFIQMEYCEKQVRET